MVVVEISGLRDMAMANEVSEWVRDSLRDNASKIRGRLDQGGLQ
jgi:hypothetical protein